MEGDYFFKEEVQAGDCLLGAGGKPVLSGAAGVGVGLSCCATRA